MRMASVTLCLSGMAIRLGTCCTGLMSGSTSRCSSPGRQLGPRHCISCVCPSRSVSSWHTPAGFTCDPSYSLMVALLAGISGLTFFVMSCKFLKIHCCLGVFSFHKLCRQRRRAFLFCHALLYRNNKDYYLGIFVCISHMLFVNICWMRNGWEVNLWASVTCKVYIILSHSSYLIFNLCLFTDSTRLLPLWVWVLSHVACVLMSLHF